MRTGIRTRGTGMVPACLFMTACLWSSPVGARQEQGPDDDERPIDEIIVTGSRIPRNEFTSPSPIQILNTQQGQQIGVSSIFELVQRAPAVNGAQIDASLNTAAFTSNATEEPHLQLAIQNIRVGPDGSFVSIPVKPVGHTGHPRRQ